MTPSRLLSKLTSTFGALLLAACGTAEPSSTWLDDDPPAECVDGDRETQRHGTACLCCHADEFGVAGSVDLQGAAVSRVVVADGDGNTANMVPNGFGNFFQHVKLTPPLSATVYGEDGRTQTMQSPANSGDCNSCHAASGVAAPLQGPAPL